MSTNVSPGQHRRISLQQKSTEVHVASHIRVARRPYSLPSDYAVWEHLHPAAVVGHVTGKAMQVHSLLPVGALLENCCCLPHGS